MIIAAVDGVVCACNIIIISSFYHILLSIYGIILPVVYIGSTIPIRARDNFILPIVI